MGAVRLKDVADACGVSIATVSRALNGLAPAGSRLTAMICMTAREMGYIPNAAALTLKTSRSNNIGILYENQLNHEYFSSLLDDFRREARIRGYDITLFGGKAEGEDEQENYSEHARRKNLDGVIVLQADFESVEVIRLATNAKPTVVIDHLYDGCDCVSSDNHESIVKRVRYARERAHSRIGYITGEDGAVTRERLAGFYKACAEMGIRVPEGFVRAGHFHEPEDCARHLRELAAGPDGATCVLCPDDFSCLGAMWKLKEEGMQIPDALSLIGYDGIRMGQMILPHLTTYRQDTARIAAETLDLLTDAIENPETHSTRQVIVEGALIEGNTVCELCR